MHPNHRMISYESIKLFLLINTIIVTTASTEYSIYGSISNSVIGYLFLYLTNILKNGTMIYLIESKNLSKPYIKTGGRQDFSLSLNLLILSILDTATHIILVGNGSTSTSILYFIPQTFIFEIIFDFFHYWSHRLIHSSTILYSVVHRLHHIDSHISCLSELNHDPADYILTNLIPLFLTQKIYPLSAYFLFIEFWYKSMVEIGGHIGKDLKTTSFPQCIYLPILFRIELRPADHNKHHMISSCNFSKRFSLWDRIFGTYNKSSTL
jgi:sterol desaturase/sphingolipid hydroxylase (fatty acid hydroxylase superfamily)